VRGGVVIVTAVLADAWLGPPALRAEEKSGGLGAGVVTGEDQYGHPLWLTANVRISLGRGLVLEPELGFWKGQRAPLDLLVEFHDLHLGASLLWGFRWHRLEPFLGGGAGTHRFDFGRGSGFHLGAHALAGFDVRASERTNLFAAARYEWIHDRAPKDGPARYYTDLDLMRFYGGLRFRF